MKNLPNLILILVSFVVLLIIAEYMISQDRGYLVNLNDDTISEGFITTAENNPDIVWAKYEEDCRDLLEEIKDCKSFECCKQAVSVLNSNGYDFHGLILSPCTRYRYNSSEDIVECDY